MVRTKNLTPSLDDPPTLSMALPARQQLLFFQPLRSTRPMKVLKMKVPRTLTLTKKFK